MTVVKLNIDTAGSRVKSFSLGLDRYHGGRPPRKRIVARDVPWLTRTYDNIAAGYPQSSCTMRRPRWTENVTEWRGNRRNRDPTIRPLISSRINARVPQDAHQQDHLPILDLSSLTYIDPWKHAIVLLSGTLYHVQGCFEILICEVSLKMRSFDKFWGFNAWNTNKFEFWNLNDRIKEILMSSL